MTPRLSIVLSVQGGVHCLAGVIEALRRQLRKGVQVLVCYPRDQEGTREICREERWVTLLEGEPGALVPHLWRDGILRADAPRVALSVVHCRPDPRWIDTLLAADLDEFTAIGGAINNDPDSDARGWAIFLLRYLRYAHPFAPHDTSDLPGDNAVYDRKVLLRYADAFTDGFWEPEIHAGLLREGRRLRLDPALCVIHANGYGTLEFTRQRLAHGRRYGHSRGINMGRVRRFLYAALSPAIPVVFGGKLVRQVLRRRDMRRHFVPALPYLVLFVGAWSIGEMRGALDAALGR